MRKKDRLKKIDIRYFLIPFISLSLVFAVLTYLVINRYVESKHESFKNTALSITHSYSHNLINSNEAYNIINDLLDEKLMIINQAIQLIDGTDNDEFLTELAERFGVDEVYLYNDKAEVIYSKDSKYVGWKAEENHPVYEFMISDHKSLIEDIRQETDSGIYYKYGYIKNDDNTFVQIGLLAENIHDFLGHFELQHIVNDISSGSDVIFASFIDNDNIIIASNWTDRIGNTVESKDIHECIVKNKVETIKTVINGEEVFQVCVPITNEGEKFGTLSIAWSTKDTVSEVNRIILSGLAMYLIVIVTTGHILYYAYKKDKSNLKMAYYDEVTGLPNSEYLYEQLDYEINNKNKNKKAILLLSCKNFETLNMIYGYKYGNQILKYIAGCISGLLKKNMMLFKFNTGNFVLFVGAYKEGSSLRKLAQRIIDLFKDWPCLI